MLEAIIAIMLALLGWTSMDKVPADPADYPAGVYDQAKVMHLESLEAKDGGATTSTLAGS